MLANIKAMYPNWQNITQLENTASKQVFKWLFENTWSENHEQEMVIKHCKQVFNYTLLL